LKDELYIVLAH